MSHQLVPSIKERIVDCFPIFVGGTDRAVELHQLALELEEGAIVAGRIVFGHWVVLLSRAPILSPREHSDENEGEKAADRTTDHGAVRNADPGIDHMADHQELRTIDRVALRMATTCREEDWAR